MDDILDELLAGISDDLTNKIGLILINTNLDKEQKLKLTEVINEAFMEGCMVVSPKWRKQSEEEMKQEFEAFKNDFIDKLTDGQPDSSAD